jgi:hypothetical protein
LQRNEQQQTQNPFQQSTRRISANLNALGGASVWANASEYFINEFYNYFTQPLLLAIGNCYPDGNVTMSNVANYALGLGSTHFPGLQSNAANASYPSGNQRPHTTLKYSQAGYTILQDLAPIDDSSR